MNINDLIERAAKYDAALARDISRFAGNRRFGLVYEESKPEFVRLYNKPIVPGDIVNILPPRGVMENLTNDVDEHETRYRILSIADGKAHLKALESDKETEVAVEDVVALSRFDEPIFAGLKEVDRVERGGDKPYQVVINGENFYALETMMFAYQGKVDCIYIDPPYNTGAKDWKYNNNYVGQDDQYRHSKWLTFMEDRLRLAKKLLNPNDSVLICTIDEKEYLRLGLLLEQLFPEATIQMVSSVIAQNASARKGQFSRNNEFLYFVMLGDAGVSELPLSDEWRANAEDKRALGLRWADLMRNGANGNRSRAPKCFYPIFVSLDGKRFMGAGEPLAVNEKIEDYKAPDGTLPIWPIHKDGREGCWGYSREHLLEIQEKGYVKLGALRGDKLRVMYLTSGIQKRVEEGKYIITGRDEDGSLISESEYRSLVASTQWNIASHNASRNGAELLKKIIGNRFVFPKSLYAVHDCLRFFVSKKQEALILDFFAGSGTTLHAINVLNEEDGGKRRCICITNNEVSAEETKTFSLNNLRQGDSEWEAHGIAHYVTWPRTKCAIEGVDVNGQPLKGTYISSDRPMSDGFAENAVFYDLEYLEPSMIAADLAFNEIAPLLWMKAGSRGRVIQHCDKYDISETYAVLFNYCYSAAFVRELRAKPDVKMVFIVTDYDARYRSMCSELPDKTVIQLYDSYLRSFEISSEG